MDSKIEQEIKQSPINERWQRDRACFSAFVKPEDAMGFEMEHFFPYYVFVERNMEADNTDGKDPMLGVRIPSGRITFFDQNDEPLFPDGDPFTNWKWFYMDPWELYALSHHLDSILPNEEKRDRYTGWIIPLYESEELKTMEEINVYLHNLMRWESMLEPVESGPIMQRFAWIMQRMYELTLDKEHADRAREAQEKKEQNKEFVEKRLEAIELRKQRYGERINRETEGNDDNN